MAATVWGRATIIPSELAVTKDAPPTFIFQTNQDTDVPAEMHGFEKGDHGVGLASDNPALVPWSVLLTNWFRGRDLIK